MGEPGWLKGELTGTCIGKPTRHAGGSGLARWFRLELVGAAIGDWSPVAGPPSTAPSGPPPFRQLRLEEARLRSLTPGGRDEELALRDVSVWDWHVRDQREAGGESVCTLVGTVYAREVGGTRRPARIEGDDRLGPWGMLAALAALLVAFWLFWSCGPFTCGMWSSVVLASWWSHRKRTRRRTPPSPLSTVMQSLLAMVLLTSGLGVALGWGGAAPNACGAEASLSVLLGFGLVVAGSLLTIAWPLPWVWVLWTLLVVPWCGRTGSDCARVWLERAKQNVLGIAPKRALPAGGLAALFSPEAKLGPKLPPAPANEARPETAGESAGGGGARADADQNDLRSGQGRAEGAGDAARPGGGAARGGAPGAVEAVGDDVSRAAAHAETPGGEGTARDEAANGKQPSADEAPRGTTAGPESAALDFAGDGALDAAGEARMSVDAALGDPRAFWSGATRVTLPGDLLFAFDEDQLRPEAEVSLKSLARLLRLDPRQRLILEGHADTIGGEQYNQELSERRAVAVRTWLVERAHVNPLQIDTVGYGDSKPIVPASKGPAAQKLNRRVEVRVLEQPSTRGGGK